MTDEPIGFEAEPAPRKNGLGLGVPEWSNDPESDHHALAARIAAIEEKLPQVTGLIASLGEARQHIAQAEACINELQQAVRHLLGQQAQSDIQIRVSALDLAIKAAGSSDLVKITELAGGFLMWLKTPPARSAQLHDAPPTEQ